MRFACLLLVFAAQTISVQAADSWLFRQSYYSHNPVTQVRVGPQVSTGPIYTRPQGAYINSGYRNMRSTIQVGGQVYDFLNVWESWVQDGQQF